MIIYIDFLILINTIFDFFLLLTVNIALKRYRKVFRLFVGAIFGNISFLSLIIPFNTFTFLLFKIFIAFSLCLISFGYKNIKYTLYNLLYFYMTSIILGGFLYYLKLNYNSNSIFYYNNMNINYFFLILIAPLILYLFLKSFKVLKEIKSYYYQVKIIFNNNFTLNIPGFLDTGNKLKDPITKKPIIIINKKIIKGKINIRSPMYVPYYTLNHQDLLPCFKPKIIYINGKPFSNYLIGLSNKSLKLNGIDCLLNYQVWEDLND